MGKDFELRLVSLVVRARELANEVIVIDLGSTDDTVKMANKTIVKLLPIQEIYWYQRLAVYFRKITTQNVPY